MNTIFYYKETNRIFLL